MSLRYAHLAPDQRREAVAKLNQKPLLALTLRLQSNHNPTVHFYYIECARRWPRSASNLIHLTHALHQSLKESFIHRYCPPLLHNDVIYPSGAC
jgi:hypothetical protein